MSLKDFLLIIEQRFVIDQADPAKEIELVNRYIEIVQEEKDIFLERTWAEIKELEMTPAEHHQRKQRREAEEKAKKEAEER